MPIEEFVLTPSGTPTIRFSGHQSFPLRIAWLPKATEEILANRDPFTDPDDGIVSLGIGKNMVEALRCWIEAYQIANRKSGEWKLSRVGEFLFGPQGRDPYLEDPTTPWLLHWMISTNRESPLGAWQCLVNNWPSSEFTQSDATEAFQRLSNQNSKAASEVTLRQHWDVFLHTYLEPKGRGDEAMDSAVSPIRLVLPMGERPRSTGRWEAVYAFDMGAKTSVSQEIFTYMLLDWWDHAHPDELTVPLRDVMNGGYSPGRVLKMREDEILFRLESLGRVSTTGISLIDSAAFREVRREADLLKGRYLDDAYSAPTYLAL